MSAADALQALGLVLLAFALACTIWVGRCVRLLDLAAAVFAFAAAMAGALVALRLAHVGQTLAVFYPIVLILALGASPGANALRPRAGLRADDVLGLAAFAVLAGLLALAGPIARAGPAGATHTRRALLESAISDGTPAALLTFHAGWLVSAVCVMGVLALCVMALLADGRATESKEARSDI